MAVPGSKSRRSGSVVRPTSELAYVWSVVRVTASRELPAAAVVRGSPRKLRSERATLLSRTSAALEEALFVGERRVVALWVEVPAGRGGWSRGPDLIGAVLTQLVRERRVRLLLDEAASSGARRRSLAARTNR